MRETRQLKTYWGANRRIARKTVPFGLSRSGIAILVQNESCCQKCFFVGCKGECEVEDSEIKPETGDTVEYGVAAYNLDGSLKSAAPRGVVTRTFKNGDIEVLADRTGKRQKLHPEEFTVLSNGN